VGARTWIESWPVYRQLSQADKLGLGAAVKSKRTASLAPRVATADKVVKSVMINRGRQEASRERLRQPRHLLRRRAAFAVQIPYLWRRHSRSS
jgi:hypothetical protein